MLHADDRSTCASRAPAWQREYTGEGGELYFRLQDWAWGNTMMGLRDALAVAIILNRRPKVIIGPESPPLNGANLSSAFELIGLDVIVESSAEKRMLRQPAGMRAISSVDQLRAMLRNPESARQPIYSRVLFSFMEDSARQLRSLAREYRGRKAWATLFTAKVPDCWAAGFLRPARRVRLAAKPLVRGSGAAVHLRVCNLVSWEDTCMPVEAPHAAARSMLSCATRMASPPLSSSFFVASDSSVVLHALKRDAAAHNLTVPPLASHSSVQIATLDGLGGTAHLSRMHGHERDVQTSFDRALFDWAAFAFSRTVLTLPSSFPASAVCMFAPDAKFVVHRLPAASGEVDCDDPLASSERDESLHPCNDLVRVNAKVLRKRSSLVAPRASPAAPRDQPRGRRRARAWAKRHSEI